MSASKSYSIYFRHRKTRRKLKQGKWPFNFIFYVLMRIQTYIYIYIRVIIPVRRWANHHACQAKCISDLFQSAEKLFVPFQSNQLKQSGTNASFGAIQIFPLLQSCLYNCKAFSTDIMPGFLCNAATARTWILLYLDIFGRVVSLSPVPHHDRSINYVYMRKERHSIPTPPCICK